MLFAVALAACSSPPADWRADVAAWRWPEPLPASLPFVDQRGAPHTLGEYADGYVLVAFVYADCGDPNACPLTLTRLAALHAAWADSGAEPPLTLLAFSLDPARDTPERMAELGARHAANDAVVLATGDVTLLSEQLPAMFSLLALPEADGQIRHDTKMSLLRPGLQPGPEWRASELEPAVVLGVLRGPP